MYRIIRQSLWLVSHMVILTWMDGPYRALWSILTKLSLKWARPSSSRGHWDQFSFKLFGIESKVEYKYNLLYSDSGELTIRMSKYQHSLISLFFHIQTHSMMDLIP